MKFRLDYVTNSSSSSFIIAYKDFPKIDADVLNKYPFLKDINSIINTILFSSGEETTKGDVCKDIESFDNYFIKKYSFREETLEYIFEQYSDAKKKYDTMVEYINKGYKILYKYVDYSDYTLPALLRNLAVIYEDYFIILEDD